MSRTYRRRGQRQDYYWVLFDRQLGAPVGALLDPRSPEGRSALARFHSDKQVTMGGAAPRWYRKVFDRRLHTFNDKQFRRWLANSDYDPVMQVRHRHAANWSWW